MLTISSEAGVKTMKEAYGELHRLGFAHSVESWKNGKLAGGLYGLAIGGAFFGESMFYRVPDASKVAMLHLVRRMRERGFDLLDVQFLTEHLARFGARQRAGHLPDDRHRPAGPCQRRRGPGFRSESRHR